MLKYLCYTLTALILILVSPTVISVPPSGAVSVKEGEETVLQCEVTGNPRPAVTWTRTGVSRAKGHCKLLSF